MQPPARNLFIVSRQANMNAFSDTEGDEVGRVIQTDRPKTCLLLIFQDPMFFSFVVFIGDFLVCTLRTPCTKFELIKSSN